MLSVLAILCGSGFAQPSSQYVPPEIPEALRSSLAQQGIGQTLAQDMSSANTGSLAGFLQSKYGADAAGSLKLMPRTLPPSDASTPLLSPTQAFCSYPDWTIPGVGTAGRCDFSSCTKRMHDCYSVYGVVGGDKCTVTCENDLSLTEQWECVADEEWQVVGGANPMVCPAVASDNEPKKGKGNGRRKKNSCPALPDTFEALECDDPKPGFAIVGRKCAAVPRCHKNAARAKKQGGRLFASLRKCRRQLAKPVCENI